MTIGLLFWVIMLILLLFGFWGARPAGGTGPWNWTSFGASFIVWILLALLGWQVFGPAIHK